MGSPERKASLGSGRIRRFFFHYVLFVMVGPQAIFVLMQLGGFDFDPRVMVWAIPALIPISLALLFVYVEGEQAPRAEPAAWVGWALGGAAMFGVWAGSYFLVGQGVDPARVRYLSSALEDQIPFRPTFALVYILLYPIFLLPFLVVRERAAFRRLVVGDLLLLATCSVAFLVFPVAFDRPALGPPRDLGTWVLSLVHGTDPAWNCLPSEHCAVAMLAALTIWEANRRIGAFAFVSALLIGLSTLFTKQHYLVDVVAGYGVSLCIFFALRWAKGLEPAVARARERVRQSSG